MPRFFFDVYNGRDTHDVEGTVLASVDEARQEAIRLAGAILRDEAHLVVEENWRMEVMNEQGEICFGLRFDVFETLAAATGKEAGLTQPPLSKS